jgi:AcrR family transcriptional regulator
MTKVIKTRERNKLDKRNRLKVAAFGLFTTRGFEATTTAQIAQASGIAKGTLFLYAKDKTDLLFLVMHDRLEEAVTRQFESLPHRGLVTQLLHVFRGLFQMYAKHPELGRAFIRALPGARGQHADRVNALTAGFLSRLAQLVVEAHTRGEVGAHVEPLIAAQSIFALYLSALMGWLSGLTSLDAALDPGLRKMLEQYRVGLSPAARTRRR